jgi:hypothetical protein
VGLHPALKSLLTVQCWTASIEHSIITVSYHWNEREVYIANRTFLKQEDMRGHCNMNSDSRSSCRGLLPHWTRFSTRSFELEFVVEKSRNLFRPSVRLSPTCVEITFRSNVWLCPTIPTALKLNKEFHTKFHTPSSTGSLVTVIKPKVKYGFYVAAMVSFTFYKTISATKVAWFSRICYHMVLNFTALC